MGLQAFFSPGRRVAALFVSVFTAASGVSLAQEQNLADEFNRRIDSSRNIAAYGPDLFGDSVSLNTGAMQMSVTDIALPGNSGLPVALTRTLDIQAAGDALPDKPRVLAPFGNWEIGIPHLSGIYSPNTGWVVDGADPLKRCSVPLGNPAAARPPMIAKSSSRLFMASEYWRGIQLKVPGKGGGELLVRKPGTQVPSGFGAVHWVTKDNWAITCLPSLANSSLGEGFLAIAPDGSRYRFDWMVSNSIKGLKKTFGYTNDSGVGVGYAKDSIARAEYVLLATRVDDRHGNFVTYTYSGSRLTKISANDGRTISLVYGTDGRISSVSAGGRTWRYGYTTGNLSAVTLPDGNAWSYSYSSEMPPNIFSPPDEPAACLDDAFDLFSGGEYRLTAKHPSGAQSLFHFGLVFHGKSYVPFQCETDDPTFLTDIALVRPKSFGTLSLIDKTISGPGLSPQTWRYEYQSAYGLEGASFAHECETQACGDSSYTDIIQPDGVRIRHTFGTRFEVNDGQLLSVETFDGGGSLRKDSNSYLSTAEADAQPFAAQAGLSPVVRPDRMANEWVRPLKQTVTTQQNSTFSRNTTAFDAFAGPSAVTRSSSLGFSSGETVEYYHDTTNWVLGQIKKLTVDGKVVKETTYTGNAQPWQLFANGQLQQTLTYNADGTLATVKDGNNRSTTLSSWYRGIPRTITFPDASKISAAVDGNGWITQVTDQLLNATGYAYDPMGRVKTVTPPIGDAVAWSPTSIDFVPVASTEYGLAAGHWRRTESRGNYRKQTFYDAYWRPVIEREYDNANATASQRFRGWQYDHDGKVVFDGYPLASATSITSFTAGTRTSYDALGRPLTVRQDSELGVLTTTYAYLTGFQTRVTNPRGFATTTSFQAFDTPDTSNPVVIQSPEGATTTIARDVFGKPLSVTRSGSYAGSALSVARRYVYDANERLCKRIEPESGATLFDYDGANNPVWSAEGTALTGTSCDRASVVSTAKVLRSYDAMNRVTLVDYPGTTADISSSYDADGALRTHSSGGSVWTYGYNKLRLQTSETLVVDGKSFAFSTGYNPLAQPVSQGYPVGAAVASTVNALGQTTAITGYASGISYYPNGAIKGFTYGNGVIRTLTQNTRGLPVRAYEVKGSTAILDDTYTYDPNGNVDYITDGLPGNLTTRDLGYDGLDRLLVADALNQWGKATYAYDPLDNLRVADQGTRQYRYNYNISTQRLDTIKTPTGGLLHSFQYNAQGDTTAKNSALYSFDAAHRLLSVANVASYSYDGHGRRIKETPQGGAVQYQVYSRAGQRLITDNSGSGNRFVYLGNTLLAAETYTGTTLGAGNFLHTDALGSVVVRTDKTTGTVTKRNAYAPYGEPYNSTIGGLGYTGHEMDLDTGLVYMQQRYYDPGVGRFLSVDPVTADTTTAWNFNRYNYAANNPYKFTDPDGRESWKALIARAIGTPDESGASQSGEQVAASVIEGARGAPEVLQAQVKELAPTAHGIAEAADATAKAAGRIESASVLVGQPEVAAVAGGVQIVANVTAVAFESTPERKVSLGFSLATAGLSGAIKSVGETKPSEIVTVGSQISQEIMNAGAASEEKITECLLCQ